MSEKEARVMLSHNITIESRHELPDLVYSDNVVDNPAYIKAIEFGKKGWNIDPTIILHTKNAYNGIITTTLPRGYLAQLLPILRKNNFKLKFENNMSIGNLSNTKLSDEYMDKFQLRPYQKDSVSASEKMKRGVIVLPTGGGKTRVAQEIIHQVGRRTMILMHNDMLTMQWVEGIEKAFNTEVGIFKNKKTPYHTADICISTFQSISATIKRHPKHFMKYASTFGLVVIDEAHHVPAVDFLNVTRYWSSERVIALTASKKRSDGSETILYRSVGPIIKEVVYLPPEYVLPAHVLKMDSNTEMISDEEAISRRSLYLSTYWEDKNESRIKRFSRSVDIKWEKEDALTKKSMAEKIKKIEPDMKPKDIKISVSKMMESMLIRNAPLRSKKREKLINNEASLIDKANKIREKKDITVNPWDIFQMSIIDDDKRNQSIVNMAVSSKVKTMIVTDRIEHADRIAALFPKDHVSLILHGGVGKSEIKKRRKEMGLADTIITTYSSFGEGIDVPALGLAIMASPTKSIIRVPQTIGRVLRPDGVKKNGFVVDIVDSMTGIGANSFRARNLIYNENINLRKWSVSSNGNIEDYLNIEDENNITVEHP